MTPRSSSKKDPNAELAEKLGPPPEEETSLTAEEVAEAMGVPEAAKEIRRESGLDPEGVAARGEYVELKGDNSVVKVLGEPEPKPVVVLLAEVLGELPPIGKDGSAPGLNYSFRQIDDIVIQTNPLFAKKGIVPVPRALSRIGEERFTARGSANYVVHLEVAYRFYGPRGDYLEAVVWGEGMDNFDKATNKAMTTAYKNALIQVLNIATGEPDPDASQLEETTGSRRPAAAGANAEDNRERREKQHAETVATFEGLGWDDGEEGIRLHKAIGDRIKALAEEDEQDKQLIADFREEAKLPWPMGPDDWNRLDEFVETLEGPGPEPETPAEDPAPPEETG